MKITRYFQSCVIVEIDGVRILIDASEYDLKQLDSFGKIDAVLSTHEDEDHSSSEIAQKYISQGVPVYANASTAKIIGDGVKVVAGGQEIMVGNVSVKAIDIPHVPMFDGSLGPQNTSYLIGEKFFHPGDGVEVSGVSCEAIALPINGTDISFKDAIALAKNVSAKTIIPIHYDYLGGNPEVFGQITDGILGTKTISLSHGQTIEL